MKKRLGLVIDQERCIGCETCTVACTLENKAAAPWIRVTTQGAARKDTPAGEFPILQMHFLPELCNHCEYPPCVSSCPQDAIQKRQDGPVVLDQEKCDGCRVCLEACPYAALSFDEDRGKAEKCHLCFHRIDQGLQPFCVICCEGQAMHFGDLNDPQSNVTRMLAAKGAFRLHLETGARPSVYYCPPRAPREL